MLQQAIKFVSGVGNFGAVTKFRIKPSKSLDANDAHIVNIVDWLFQYEFQQRASDIHTEPRRQQGSYVFVLTVSTYGLPVPASDDGGGQSLKVIRAVNVAKRKPQDGRVKTKTPDGNEVDYVSLRCQRLLVKSYVMRIFDPEVLLKSFDQFGFSGDDLQRWRSMTCQPNGIIFITGPTGSGKTTRSIPH